MKAENLYVLGRIGYIDRDDDRDFTYSWYLFRVGKEYPLQNTANHEMEFAPCSLWHRQERPERYLTHWAEEEQAERYLQTFCEKIG